MKALEMKTNADGITNGTWKRLPAFYNCNEWERDNLEPNTRYACCMIAIPEGYRLVTDEERGKYKKCKGVCAYTSIACAWAYGSNCGHHWNSKLLYAVPIDHEWAEDKQRVSISVEVNGKAVDPATLSADTWAALRGQL